MGVKGGEGRDVTWVPSFYPTGRLKELVFQNENVYTIVTNLDYCLSLQPIEIAIGWIHPTLH